MTLQVTLLLLLHLLLLQLLLLLLFQVFLILLGEDLQELERQEQTGVLPGGGGEGGAEMVVTFPKLSEEVHGYETLATVEDGE